MYAIIDKATFFRSSFARIVSPKSALPKASIPYDFLLCAMPRPLPVVYHATLSSYCSTGSPVRGRGSGRRSAGGSDESAPVVRLLLLQSFRPTQPLPLSSPLLPVWCPLDLLSPRHAAVTHSSKTLRNVSIVCMLFFSYTLFVVVVVVLVLLLSEAQ